MIAGCTERIRNDACGDCARKDPCKALFTRLFGGGGWAQPRRERGRPPARAAEGSPFLAFLREVAKAVEPKVPPAPSRFRREVEAKVEALLEGGDAKIGSVARSLGLSRQTLYRRLKAEGTTFEALLDGVRRKLALKLIRDEGVSVKEAAWRLGFSDPAAFSRAFKRWMGRSPREMRGSGGQSG